MKYRFLTIAICALMLSLTSGIAVARQNNQTSNGMVRVRSGSAAKDMGQKSPLKVSTEFGLGVGARYNWMQVQPISEVFTPNITMKMSYGAALQFRVNIGKYFGIQPEISYCYANIKIKDSINKFSAKAKSNIVQVPLLLSLRLAMFRINAGPVFTLMDNPTYQVEGTEKDTYTQLNLGKIFPTVTYTAGISVKFAKCMMVDVRYSDQFCDIKSENAYIWTLDTTKQAEAQRFRTRSRSVQVRIGYVF